MLPFLLLAFFHLALANYPGLHKQETIQLGCPGGCPILDNPSPRWIEMYPGWLIMNVSVDDTKVLLNGREVYPEVKGPFSVTQVSHGDIWKYWEEPIAVEASVTYGPAGSWKEWHMYPVTIQITKLLGQAITVEGLTFDVSINDDGLVYIQTLKTVPYMAKKPKCKCTGATCKMEYTNTEKFETVSAPDVVSCTIEYTEAGKAPKESLQNALNSGFWFFGLALMSLVSWNIFVEIRNRKSWYNGQMEKL